MKKWELRREIERLEGSVISLQMDNGQLRTRVRNLKERVNRHNERVEELESELAGLRLVELNMSMTEEELDEYEEGIEQMDKGEELIPSDIETITSCHCDTLSRQDVKEIVLGVIKSIIEGVEADWF